MTFDIRMMKIREKQIYKSRFCPQASPYMVQAWQGEIFTWRLFALAAEPSIENLSIRF